MENGLSNSDVALLAGRNNDGIFGGDNGLVWLLAFSEPPKYMQDIHHNITDCYATKYANVKVLLDAYSK